MFATQCILFRHACDRERLTWKAGEKDIVVGDVVGVDFGDVAMNRMRRAEVLDVSPVGICIPLAGEDALPADLVEGQP